MDYNPLEAPGVVPNGTRRRKIIQKFVHDPLHMKVKSVTGFFCKMKSEVFKNEKRKKFWLKKITIAQKLQGIFKIRLQIRIPCTRFSLKQRILVIKNLIMCVKFYLKRTIFFLLISIKNQKFVSR